MDTETARAQAAEGNLADLTTACKTSLTAAVNELASELDSFPAAVQTLGGEYLIGNFAGAYITALQ
jgi:hypothetical protein